MDPRGECHFCAFFIFKNKLISVSIRKAVASGSKGKLGEKLHGVTDSLPVSAVKILLMPSPKDLSERKENGHLSIRHRFSLAWIQVNLSSVSMTLDVASTKPCVSPRREGHTLNPNLGLCAQPKWIRKQRGKHCTSAPPCQEWADKEGVAWLITCQGDEIMS